MSKKTTKQGKEVDSTDPKVQEAVRVKKEEEVAKAARRRASIESEEMKDGKELAKETRELLGNGKHKSLTPGATPSKRAQTNTGYHIL